MEYSKSQHSSILIFFLIFFIFLFEFYSDHCIPNSCTSSRHAIPRPTAFHVLSVSQYNFLFSPIFLFYFKQIFSNHPSKVVTHSLPLIAFSDEPTSRGVHPYSGNVESQISLIILNQYPEELMLG